MIFKMSLKHDRKKPRAYHAYSRDRKRRREKVIYLISNLFCDGNSYYYAGGFIGSHSKKTSSSPFFGVEVFTIMSPI